MLKIVKAKNGDRFVVDKDNKRFKIVSEHSDAELLDNLAELVKLLKLKKRRNKKRQRKLKVDDRPIMTVTAASNIDKLRIEQLQVQLNKAIKTNAPAQITDSIKTDLKQAENKFLQYIVPRSAIHNQIIGFLYKHQPLIKDTFPDYYSKTQSINPLLLFPKLKESDLDKAHDVLIKSSQEYRDQLPQLPIPAPPVIVQPQQQTEQPQSTALGPDDDPQYHERVIIPIKQAATREEEGDLSVDNLSSLFDELNITGKGSDNNNDEKGLSGAEIQELCADIPTFKGVFAADQIDKIGELPVAAIINLDDSSEPGSHWCSLIIDRDIEWYDSFGRPPNAEILAGIKRLIKNKFKQLKINTVKWQETSSSNCGWFAIRYLVDRIVNKKTFKDSTGFSIVERFIDELSASRGEDEIEEFKDVYRPFGDL